MINWSGGGLSSKIFPTCIQLCKPQVQREGNTGVNFLCPLPWDPGSWYHSNLEYLGPVAICAGTRTVTEPLRPVPDGPGNPAKRELRGARPAHRSGHSGGWGFHSASTGVHRLRKAIFTFYLWNISIAIFNTHVVGLFCCCCCCFFVCLSSQTVCMALIVWFNQWSPLFNYMIYSQSSFLFHLFGFLFFSKQLYWGVIYLQRTAHL